MADNSSKFICDAFSERIKYIGVTRAQWIAIYYLGLVEDMSQRELAEKMKINESSIARLLDRMERDQLIERIKNNDDKRITNLNLSNYGRKKRLDLIEEGEKFEVLLYEGITLEEINTTTAILEKMVSNVSNKA